MTQVQSRRGSAFARLLLWHSKLWSGRVGLAVRQIPEDQGSLGEEQTDVRAGWIARALDPNQVRKRGKGRGARENCAGNCSFCVTVNNLTDLRYKRQLTKSRCCLFVNQQRTRQELVISDRKLIYRGYNSSQF